MEIYTTLDRQNNNARNAKVSRHELTELQERAYIFAENMLKTGTRLLKIEAKARLAANDLCFSDIYFELDR